MTGAIAGEVVLPDAKTGFREVAPAKINLWLKVLGRRDDGYHILDSLVAFADFGEALSALPAPAMSLAIEGPEGEVLVRETSATHHENLVLRAARAFQTKFGGGSYAFTLEKHLPIASGIGGGSADAAAALRLMASAHGVDLAAPALTDLALELGADIPMCLMSKAALIGGIGEHIAPVSGITGFSIVAVNPRLEVATPAAFKALAAPPVSGTPPVPQLASHTTDEWLARISEAGNDLEAPVSTKLVPEIAEIRRLLEPQPGCHLARMSGSGATVFGLFEDLEEAEEAAGKVRSNRAEWWVRSGGLF